MHSSFLPHKTSGNSIYCECLHGPPMPLSAGTMSSLSCLCVLQESDLEAKSLLSAAHSPPHHHQPPPEPIIKANLLRLMICLLIHTLLRVLCSLLMRDVGRKSVTISFIKEFVNQGISADLTSDFKLPKKRMEKLRITRGICFSFAWWSLHCAIAFLKSKHS